MQNLQHSYQGRYEISVSEGSEGGSANGALRDHEARRPGPPVEEHGTRATVAELAAILGAGQPEVFPEQIEKRLLWREGDLDPVANHHEPT